VSVDDLLTVTEAAGVLGTARKTVDYLIQRGDLEAFRLPCKDGKGGNRRGYLLYVPKVQVEKLKDGSWRRQAPRKKEDGAQ